MSRDSFRQTLAEYWPLIALIVPIIFVVLVVDLSAGVSVQRPVTEALIKIVAVVGLYIFIGNTGIISFGSVAFMGIAAYASAWQTCCARMKPIMLRGLPEFLQNNTIPIIPSAIAAVVLTTAAAFLIALIIMRLTGLGASIATLAVLFIFSVSYVNWESVTMGASSMVGLPVYVSYWVAMACAIGAIFIAFFFQRSRWGLLVRATREDPVAAQAAGVSLYWMRVLTFTLSGAVMAVAGILHAHFLGTISVDTFYLNLTFILLAMLVVGGMGSLSGAVVGVAVISIVVDLVRRMGEGVSIGSVSFSLPSGSPQLALAAIMLLILVFRRQGLVGSREFRFPFRSKPGEKDVTQ